jgi:hypothetical protein
VHATKIARGSLSSTCGPREPTRARVRLGGGARRGRVLRGNDVLAGMTSGTRGSATARGRRRAGCRRLGPEDQLGRDVGSCASWAAGRGVERAAACCWARLGRMVWFRKDRV